MQSDCRWLQDAQMQAIGYPILLDYFYLMAYVVTLLMFMDLLLDIKG